MPKSLYEENSLLLEEPSRHEWNAMQNQLNSSYNKDQMLRFASTFIPWLGNYSKIYKKNQNGNIREAKELNEMLKNISAKYVITEGVTLILASTANLQQYIDSMKPQLRDLWHEVLLYGYVSHDRAKQILNIKSNLFESKYSYYYYNSSITWNKREYGWFITKHLHSRKNLDYGYSTFEDYITVSNNIRGIFFPLFFPELKQSDFGQHTLPEGEWRTVDLETESYSAFTLFSGLFKQGELPMKKKGITNADMKRADKKLALTELFPDDKNEYRQYLRAYNYMGVLGLNEHLKSAYKAKKILSYPDTLLDLFKNFEKLDNYLPQLLYPHIKGLRQNQTQWGHHDRLCRHLMEWLKEHPDSWVALSDVYLKIVELGSDGNNGIYTALVYSPSEEQSNADINNLYTLKGISADDYAREFGITGLQAFASILTSLGMAEVAIKNPTHDSSCGEDGGSHSQAQKQAHELYTPLPPEGGAGGGASPFDGIGYLRLTALGRYALGVTANYETPKIEQEAYFELDPERLIIRSLQDPNPYEQLLRDTAQPISRGRFQTSALSFLTNCHDRNDVEGKINIFKQFIANELPPLWEQFFQQLLQHCHPLTEDKTSYRHYTLKPDNTDLINLLTTDPTLRQIVIRGEGYRILVKNEDLRKFETQLKKHGYLL